MTSPVLVITRRAQIDAAAIPQRDVDLLTRETVNRQWDEKFNLFPIPQSEIQKNGNLTQNPNW